ncbi:MAG TPA: hypothetical protein VE127_01765, partial [Solirubrobacteraceae bacterium]|nr:hypothetical protein [Solirubrobacteraceae bacterium]
MTGLAGNPLRSVTRALRRERSGAMPGGVEPMQRPSEPRLQALDASRVLRSPETVGDPVLALALQRAVT